MKRIGGCGEKGRAYWQFSKARESKEKARSALIPAGQSNDGLPMPSCARAASEGGGGGDAG